MTVQLESLRVEAEVDASKYTAGAQQVTAASDAMGRSVTKAGESFKETDTKVAAANAQLDVQRRNMLLVAESANTMARATGAAGNALATIGNAVPGLQPLTGVLAGLTDNMGKLSGAGLLTGTTLTGMAVGVGGVFAVLTAGAVALVSAMDDTAAAAERQRAAVEQGNQAWSRATAAAAEYREGLASQTQTLDELQRYYGTLTDAVLDLERVQVRTAANAVDRARADQASQITSAGRGLADIATGQTMGYDALGVATGYRDAADAANLLTDRQRALTTAIQAFDDAGRPTVETVAELRRALEPLASGSDTVADAVNRIREQIITLLPQVRDLAGQAQRLSGQAGAVEGDNLPLPPPAPPAGLFDTPGGGGRQRQDDGVYIEGADGQVYRVSRATASAIEADRRTREQEARTAQTEADRSRREATQATQQATREFDQEIRSTGNRFANDIARGLIDGTQRGAPVMGQILSNIARSTLSRGVAEALSSAVIQPGLRAGATALGFGPAGSAANDNGGDTAGLLQQGLGFGRSLFGQFSGSSSTGGVTSYIDGLGASTGIFGAAGGGQTSASLLAAVNSPGGLSLAPSLGPNAVAGGGLLGGTTLSGFAGGVGLGFGAGQLTNTLLGGNTQNGTIGSAGGAVAGAIIGSIIPGVGTVIGGLVGGAAGGGIGGLFGGKDKEAFSGGSVEYMIGPDGKLAVTKSGFKGYDSAKGLADAQATLDRTNSAVYGAGLRFNPVAQGGTIGYGTDATPGRDQADFGNIVRAGLASDNANINRFIGNRDLSTDQVISGAQFVTQIYEPLLKAKDATSEFEKSVNAVRDSYGPAIDRARELGLATEGLVAVQAKAVADLEDQRAKAVVGIEQGYAVRGLRATGQGGAADSLAFDISARAEIDALTKTLEQLGLGASDAAGLILRAETTLAQERVAIVQRTELEALQKIKSQAGILTSFLDAQAVSGAGVSPQDSFRAAQGIFGDAVSAARNGGDLSAVTSAASQLLNANSAYNASGEQAGFVRNSVLSTVRGLGASLDLPGFGASLETALARYTAPNTDAITGLTREVADLREELRAARLRAA